MNSQLLNQNYLFKFTEYDHIEIYYLDSLLPPKILFYSLFQIIINGRASAAALSDFQVRGVCINSDGIHSLVHKLVRDNAKTLRNQVYLLNVIVKLSRKCITIIYYTYLHIAFNNQIHELPSYTDEKKGVCSYV